MHDFPEQPPKGGDDLLLLERYLDDDLSGDAIAALRNRLADEPELSAALREIRDQRVIREALWQSMEPSDAEARSLSAGVRAAVDRQSRWYDRVNTGARLVGAAACVALGVWVGWSGRGSAAGGPAGNGLHAMAPTRVQNLQNPGVSNAMATELGGGSGLPSSVQSVIEELVGRPPKSPAAPAAEPDEAASLVSGRSNDDQPVRVLMVNSQGRVVGVQWFDSAADARQFISQMSRRPANGN